LLRDVVNPVTHPTGVEFFGPTGTAWVVRHRLDQAARRAFAAYVGPDTAAEPTPNGDEAVGAFAASGVAVRAEAPDGLAVGAVTKGGIAVSAVADAAGVALRATGAVSFSSAGTAKFRKGQSQVAVEGVRTPPGAKILVTLSQNPGKENALKYVRRTSDTGFTVHLLRPVPGVVAFSYFVIL
jgi:hypothetical protein